MAGDQMFSPVITHSRSVCWSGCGSGRCPDILILDITSKRRSTFSKIHEQILFFIKGLASYHLQEKMLILTLVFGSP